MLHHFNILSEVWYLNTYWIFWIQKKNYVVVALEHSYHILSSVCGDGWRVSFPFLVLFFARPYYDTDGVVKRLVMLMNLPTRYVVKASGNSDLGSLYQLAESLPSLRSALLVPGIHGMGKFIYRGKYIILKVQGANYLQSVFWT